MTDQLDLHEARRAQGLPTVSVFVGAVPLAIERFTSWAQQHGHTSVLVRHTTLEAVLRGCSDVLLQSGELQGAALARLAAGLGRPAEELKERLQGGPSRDLELLFAALYAGEPRLNVARLCRGLLDPASKSPFEPLERLLAEDPMQLADALAAVLPAARWPACLLVPALTRSGGGWLVEVARACDALLGAVPQMRLAVAARRSEWDAYLRSTPERRAKALLRDGTIVLDSASTTRRAESQAAARGNAATGEPGTPGPAEASESGPGALLPAADAGGVPGRAGAEASPAPAAAVTPKADEEARGAAERLLYERLEALPQTRGLFELNGRPGFEFGPGPAEVDLWCRELRLAVEVDGYWHFQDPETWRRDRRKDLLLQQEGCLVLRVMAEDVAARTEEVLQTILDATSRRRG